MFIKRIRVKNFRSFKDTGYIDLGKFNVLIGANASGKSNFVELFRFLMNIEKEGLENAIAMVGGREALLNNRLGKRNNFELEISGEHEKNKQINLKDISVKYQSFEVTKISFSHYFKISFRKNRLYFMEKIVINYQFNLFRHGKKGNIFSIPYPVELILLNTNGEISTRVYSKSNELKRYFKILLSYNEFEDAHDSQFKSISIFNRPHYYPLFSTSFGIFVINKKTSQNIIPAKGKLALDENAEDLARIVKNILENKEYKRKYLNLIRDLLPFIDDVKIDESYGSHIGLDLKEKYSSKYLPQHLMSDGTFFANALITALYFDKRPITIIEEPERGLHPSIISNLVDMMQNDVPNKQIIVTTHNPELVKHTNLENLLLVTRDEEGFSQIKRPNDSPEVKIFLKNELGVDDLFVQNLLEV